MPRRRPPSEVRRFQRAAENRLREAKFLYQSDFFTAAVYLGGYAVECILKALVLSSEPGSQHHQTMVSFRGARGHAFEWLRLQLRKRKINLPDSVQADLGRVAWWTTDLRYHPGEVKKAVARDFLVSVEQTCAWAKGKLG